MHVEQRIRFYGQLVPGQVLRSEFDGSFKIRHGQAQALIRQTKHEIEINTLKTRLSRHRQRPAGFCRRMNPAEPVQHSCIKTLDANGQPVDACCPITIETLCINGTGICLQSDLDIWRQRHYLPDTGKQTIDGCSGKQAGRASANKDATQFSGGHECAFMLQVQQQRGHIGVFTH